MATRSSITVIKTENDFILTTVTADPGVTTDWISNVRQTHARVDCMHNEANPLVIGFATEFHRSREQLREPVDTLQLCDGNACLIFQIHHAASIPDSLHEFLNDPNNVFVGVRIGQDCRKLSAFHDLRIGNRVKKYDLGSTFTARPEHLGYRGLVKAILGKRYEPKRGQLISWYNEVLTKDQVECACLDAYYCFEMWMALSANGQLPVPV